MISHHQRPFLAIDGEGLNNSQPSVATYGKQTVTFYHQRYVLMTASDASGEDQHVLSAWDGELRTESVLRWLIDLPAEYIPVGYSLGYDYTKMLKDVPKSKLYQLYHPDIGDGYHTSKMIWWRGWGLRWLNNRLEIVRGQQRRTIWDVSKFFQAKFADAMKAWVPEVADDIDFVESMKAERDNLAALDPAQVEKYALMECRNLAVMMTRLRQACADADIPLSSYFGAGSIASGLIKRHGTKQYQGPINDERLRQAVADAFVGGRFESAVHGPVRQPIYETDVSSAYPSAYLDLPCLACGEWQHVSQQGLYKWWDATVTLYRVVWNVPRARFGPFPMRTPTLAYPLKGAAWIWEAELVAAMAAFPDGDFTTTEAWSYLTTCDHRPHEWVRERFAQRLAWSKEQRGIVLKLGLNAIYGKYAQQVGGRDGSYTNLVWAGLITSYTRAKLLDALAVGGDAVIAFATDGILSLRDLGIGTKEKILGGWEAKEPIDGGAFFVANGLVVPYDQSRVRSRGYEARVIRESIEKIEAAWDAGGIDAKVKLSKRQFVNTKLALSCSDFQLHGEWIDEVIEQGFNPAPARRDFYSDNGITYSYPMESGTAHPYAERCMSVSHDPNAKERRALKRWQSGIRTEPLPAEIAARWQGGIVDASFALPNVQMEDN